MSWQAEVEALQRREAMAMRSGGNETRPDQPAGKLSARQRIQLLLDDDSFNEVGKIAGYATYDAAGELTHFAPAAVLFGRGRIDERAVVVAADAAAADAAANDDAVEGAAVAATAADEDERRQRNTDISAAKRAMAERMAWELRLPLVRLLDGAGGLERRGQGTRGVAQSLDPTTARSVLPRNPGWGYAVQNLTQVPVVSVVCGPVSGQHAMRAASSHYCVIVKTAARLFVAGAEHVARIGESIDDEALGGSHVHVKNGVVDDEAMSEHEAIARAQRFLSFLPPSVHELPPRGATDDDPERIDEALLNVVPRQRRKVYKMRAIIKAVADRDSFMEIGRGFGRSLITGLARLRGWPVAVVAEDPYHYGGAWTADAAQKLTRFIDLAEAFHLPVIRLVDTPGFLIGSVAEQSAILRHGARALAAIHQSNVPWCSVFIRKVYGAPGAAHGNPNGLHLRYAWPSAEWGAAPLELDVEHTYRALIEQSADKERLAQEIHERLNRVRSPLRTADAFGVEQVIDPRRTRALLCEFADLAAPRRHTGAGAFRYRP